jgi:hypothetical protein
LLGAMSCYDGLVAPARCLWQSSEALSSAAYGIVGVLGPGFLLANYGVSPEAAVILMIRFFSATLITWVMIIWQASDCTDWVALRAPLLAHVVGDAVALWLPLLVL